MTNVEPLADRLLVRPAAPETSTTSGILIPPSSQEEPQQGTVVAIGDECKPLAVGDTILHSRYGTTKVRIDGVDLLIMRLADVMAKVDSRTSSKKST
jgi:chaperonin GroES